MAIYSMAAVQPLVRLLTSPILPQDCARLAALVLATAIVALPVDVQSATPTIISSQMLA